MRIFAFATGGAPRLLALVLAAVVLSAICSAQESRPPVRPREKTPASKTSSAPTSEVAERKRFALDIVQSALALPQPDPQDRLTVLVAAAKIASVVAPDLARSLGKEGVDIENRVLAAGDEPAVSMLQSRLADCRSSAAMLDSLSLDTLRLAEPSLVAVVQRCARTALPGMRRKMEQASEQGVPLPRALLATVEASDPRSAWSQQQCEAVFTSLPDPMRYAREAVNYAALYQRACEASDKGVARASGLKLISWLGKVQAMPERSQALSTVAAAMQKILGEEKYREALRSDVMAGQVIQAGGQSFEVSPPDEGKSVSVLRAMKHREGEGDTLQGLGPAQKARQAAAYGFAAARSGDPAAATRYFDTAFSALEDAWALRGPRLNAAAVVEEVTEAAGRVDAVGTLARAQRLQDPAARAISMLAVAQVVLTRQPSPAPPVANAGTSAR